MNTRRIVMDKFYIGCCVLAVSAAVAMLLAVTVEVTIHGLGRLDLNFFTQLPPAPDGKKPGGLGNAIQGSLILVSASSALGIPLGLLSGIYISEYGLNTFGPTIRFLGDVLAGVPTIVTGLMVFFLIVIPTHAFSTLAGSVALGMIMIPIVSNTSAQALRAVPTSTREASVALGVGKWRTTLVVLANAKKSVATACILAMSRVLGETAPILLTVGASVYWYGGAWSPVATLTYYIYYYALSPFQNWIAVAWTAALVLLIMVFAINIVIRLVTRGKRVYV